MADDQTKSSNVYVRIKPLGRKFIIYEKVPFYRYVELIIAEFTGTFILLFLSSLADGVLSNILEVTFAVALSISVSVECVSHISGSHINPAVSLGAFLAGYLSLIHLCIYMISQLLGSIAGHATALAIVSKEMQEAFFNEKSVGIFTLKKRGSLEDWQVCICEYILTFLIVIVCTAVWDWRNRKIDSLGIRFGFLIAVLILAGGDVSGAGLNPARAIGPSINNGEFLSYHWVYYVGPFMAGITGGLLYRIVFQTPEPGYDDVDG
ncbi:aquaporin-like [Onthophagus taurus]|uniref:aquaporin-like n=1 Tax=Onthophagus taurus TaxID=166361 RepID=UPI000C205C7E|nr:aquaporin-like [Onthophagus taurus]